MTVLDFVLTCAAAFAAAWIYELRNDLAAERLQNVRLRLQKARLERDLHSIESQAAERWVRG